MRSFASWNCIGRVFLVRPQNGRVVGFENGRMWENVSVKMGECENAIPDCRTGFILPRFWFEESIGSVVRTFL
jgi:hypothetical protein